MANAFAKQVISDKRIKLEECGGVRLDAAVVSFFPETTRSFVREAVAAGEILVNGRRAAKGLKLKNGDEVFVKALAEKSDNLVLPNPDIKLHLVHEDETLLAFDKPAGIAVHPNTRLQKDTLMNGVVTRYPECLPLGDRPLMAGALHRIDSGTSGLVLVARSPQAFEAMRSQFSGQSVEKNYLALVEGNVVCGATLENNLIHDPGLPYCKMVDSLHNRLTKEQRAAARQLHAVTAYRPLAHTKVEAEERTLLEVVIYTGVTHQIRAQLAMAGLHIINDRLYGAFAVEGMVGHALHALSATFVHPSSSQRITVSTPLPQWARGIL